jgi:hypothetical protein
MRIPSLIFAVYLAVLSFLPGVAAMVCDEECSGAVYCLSTCEQATGGNEDTPEKKEKGPGSCPMGICGTNCMVYIGKAPYTGLTLTTVLPPVAVQHAKPLNDQLPKDYYTEYWNPPKY